MRFKCTTCGAEFDDIQQFASHKKHHQSTQSGGSGITCLGCASKIPIDASKANYSGPLTCPSCHRTMKVTLRDSEVVVARLG